MFTIVTWHNIVIVVKYAALAGLGWVTMYVHSATQTKRILGHLVKFCNCCKGGALERGLIKVWFQKRTTKSESFEVIRVQNCTECTAKHYCQMCREFYLAAKEYAGSFVALSLATRIQREQDAHC